MGLVDFCKLMLLVEFLGKCFYKTQRTFRHAATYSVQHMLYNFFGNQNYYLTKLPNQKLTLLIFNIFDSSTSTLCVLLPELHWFLFLTNFIGRDLSLLKWPQKWVNVEVARVLQKWANNKVEGLHRLYQQVITEMGEWRGWVKSWTR